MNLLLLCVLCALRGELSLDEGYLGADVKDNASGQTVFSWFAPGPLDGAGLQSNAFDLHRPDVLVSIDGKTMNAAEFNAYIASLAPGASVTIQYLKATQRDTANIPESVATEGEPQTITVVLESKEEYTGTIGRPRLISVDRDIPLSLPVLLNPFDPDNTLGGVVDDHELRDEIIDLLAVFDETRNETSDSHMLPLVRAAFRHPFSLAEVQDWVDVRKPRRRFPFRGDTEEEISLDQIPVMFVASLYQEILVSEGFGGTGILTRLGNVTTNAGSELALKLASAQTSTDRAFRSLTLNQPFAQQCLEVLRTPRRSFYIAGPESKRQIEVMRESLDVDWAALGNFLIGFEREIIDRDVDAMRQRPTIDPPAESGAVGMVFEAVETRLGSIIVGSDDNNRYDMSKVAAVFDIGGDDEYWASDLRIGTRAIIDLAGNDTYTGTPDQGPGGAILGVSFIDDRAGNDTYKGELLSCGAAIYGVSLLLDRGGNDTYSGTDWSMGAGVYGAGMLIDLGDGDDTYTGEFLCQGVGGPRGFGAIIDEGGDDTYMANGPQPSMYGDAGVFASFSQGVGFGYRGYAAGGIGMLSDLGGNDRYESGEFSQGGAYYFALGILHDAEGDDEYIGSRYSQGFGVHQAFGILADDAGDDVYTSKTAASQGAAWDIGAGLLIDRAGNDTYTCDGLGQGGASMQGIAMLVDLAGEDKYNATGGATQGESGGNSYHFAKTRAFSFSLLWDEGGGIDFFSRGRENNTVTSTGVVNEQDPANSGAHGLVIDR